MADKIKAEWIDECTISCHIADDDNVEIHYPTNYNWQASQRIEGDFLRDYIEPLVDHYKDSESDKLWGIIYRSHLKCRFEPPKSVVRNPKFPDNPMVGFFAEGEFERIALGREIKKLCVERGMEQKKLAEIIGMTPGNLSRIVQGKVSVGYDILCKIAYALGKKVVLVDIADDDKR